MSLHGSDEAGGDSAGAATPHGHPARGPVIDRGPVLMLAAGAVCALIAVAAGAFGAHALRGRIDATMINAFETGVRYQMFHALALLATGLAAARWPHRLWGLAASAFALGVLLFSGSLYLVALSGWRAIGWVTPVGGIAFLIGWGLFCAATLRITRAGAARP